MRYILLFVLCSLKFTLSGQHQLSGSVVDSDELPLVGATVVLLDSDSLMVSFALTNTNGHFSIDDVSTGMYILQMSYISYANYSRELEVKSGMEVGIIVMHASTEVLQEVTIKAEHIPMGISGDTISYNAAAFKTRPNATVEDLLKKLPGIEVDRQGNIKAQGEDVQNVLVDGKEFFGSDTRMATQNLDAEAIEKVDVYDKKSDIAEFTGVEDGQEEKTIDLKLKEDRKKGGFGSAALAAGSSETYDGKLNYFRFSPKLQASIISAGNNINRQTFTVNDRIDFMGGMMEAMSGGMVNLSQYGGQQDGINESLSSGANVNYDFSSKLKLRAHYLLNRINNKVAREQRQSSFTDEFEFTNASTSSSELTNYEHQVNTNIKYKYSPFTDFVIRNNMSWGSDINARTSTSDYVRANVPSGTTFSDFSSSRLNWNYDSNFLLKKKFRKKGRSFINSWTFKKSSTDSEEYVEQRNRILGIQEDFRQVQRYTNPVRQVSTSINYTEPLSKKYYLSTEYAYGNSLEQPLRKFDEEAVEFRNNYTYNLGGFSLRRNTKKLKVNVGIKGQWTMIKGILRSQDEEINKSFTHLLPSFSVNYDFSGGKSVNADLFSRVEAPRIRQLAPILDNTYANYAFIGNPALRPSVKQQLSLAYNYFDNFNFVNFWVRLGVERTKDRIVNKVSVDDNFFRTSTPINTDEYLGLSAFLNFSSPLKPLKINYKLRARLRYAQYESFLNEEVSGIRENNINLRASFSNRKTKYVSLESGISWDVSVRNYAINSEFNQVFSNTDFFLESEFYLPKAWIINSELSYNHFSDEQFSAGDRYVIWSLGISKFFLENKLEVNVRGFDLLNQNLGFRRYGLDNALVEESYTNLSRYFMLGITYKIGSGKKSGIRIEIDE